MKYTIKLQKGNLIQKSDNTKIPTKQSFSSIPLNQEQIQNYKMYGELNRPLQKETILSQGKKKTVEEQKQSDSKLASKEKLENYQKQQEQDAKNLEKAIAVAPYVIPGIGQAMWAGKAVDLATSGASKGKYKSWGNMVDQNTGSGEFIGDLSNPGYMISGVSQLLKKPAQQLTSIPKIKIQLGRDKIIPDLGHVKNFNVYLNGKQILNQDLQNSLNIVDKGNEIVVGNIFLPEELRGKGLTKKIYQELANFNKKPLVSSSKYGLNQSESGARIWKNRESFIPKTSFKTYLLNKAEPYLLGEKSIPMMGGYKPRTNFIENGVENGVDATTFGVNRIFEGKPLMVSSNENAFKTTAGKFYRLTGKPQIDDIANNGGYVLAKRGKIKGGRFGETHWTKADGHTYNPNEGGYLIETNNIVNNQVGGIPSNSVNIYKVNNGKWELHKPSSFKSEINWGNWNKEIPSNTNLIKEYNTIEQTAKQNGTWMKNADNSVFSGTPEQFVQQRSSNFKKAFPDGSGITYRGDRTHYPELDYNPIFTGDKQMALNYTQDNASYWTPNHPFKAKSKSSDPTSGGLHELYYNPNRIKIKIDAKNKDYTRLKLDEIAGDDYISTDDVARRIASGSRDAEINNVYDASVYPGTVRIINHNYGSNNFMKSARGNNGMFDMTNPNIYKGLIPAVGLYGLTQSQKQGGTIHIKPENKGKFTETKAKTGKSTEELTHSKNPITKKRAIFAQNAKKWKHQEGGSVSKKLLPKTKPKSN